MEGKICFTCGECDTAEKVIDSFNITIGIDSYACASYNLLQEFNKDI